MLERMESGPGGGTPVRSSYLTTSTGTSLFSQYSRNFTQISAYEWNAVVTRARHGGSPASLWTRASKTEANRSYCDSCTEVLCVLVSV
jgi:hypothetical protein